jgi:tRNA-specific 2-thiouridylase
VIKLENKKRVLLGMSGGVDSAVSAILLKKSGFEVIGVTMRLFEVEHCDGYNENPVEDAKEVCDKLGIEHYVYDFRDEFKKYVIDNFVEAYKNGKTPNPCIECNRYLKFGKMYEISKKLDCEYIATGHYAKIEYSDKYENYVLKKSHNEAKDQSYVVYPISKEILSHVIFPLEKFESKEEIRKIAKENGLFVASKPDSEDICFIPDNNHIRFLDENIKVKEGKIYDLEGRERGKHTGFTHYTIGQRKGLGVQNPNPLYVVKIKPETNEVVVGEKNSVLNNEVKLENINVLVDNVLTKEGVNVKVKIRYKSKEVNAKAYLLDNNIKILFELPQFAITPGQSCVIYVDDVVIAGGIITK